MCRFKGGVSARYRSGSASRTYLAAAHEKITASPCPVRGNAKGLSIFFDREALSLVRRPNEAFFRRFSHRERHTNRPLTGLGSPIFLSEAIFMLKMIRDWRVRVLLSVILFTIIGVAIYQLVLKFQADQAIQLANQALDLGDFEEAGVHLERYLACGPMTRRSTSWRQTARRRGDIVNAELHLRLASNGGADPDTLAFEHTLCRIQRGDLFQATPFAKLCAQNPSDPKAWAVLEALIEGCLLPPRINRSRTGASRSGSRTPAATSTRARLCSGAVLSGIPWATAWSDADHVRAGELAGDLLGTVAWLARKGP